MFGFIVYVLIAGGLEYALITAIGLNPITIFFGIVFLYFAVCGIIIILEGDQSTASRCPKCGINARNTHNDGDMCNSCDNRANYLEQFHGGPTFLDQ